MFDFHNPKIQYSSEPDGEFPYQRYFKVLSLLVLRNEADATRQVRQIEGHVHTYPSFQILNVLQSNKI